MCTERVFLLGIPKALESFEGGDVARQPYRFPQAGTRERGSGVFRLTVRRLSGILHDVGFWRNSLQMDSFAVLD